MAWSHIAAMYTPMVSASQREPFTRDCGALSPAKVPEICSSLLSVKSGASSPLQDHSPSAANVAADASVNICFNVILAVFLVR